MFPQTSLLFLLLAATTEKCTTKAAVFGNSRLDFPRFQKNYWYEYSTPSSTTYPEYIDYHLSPETTSTVSPNMPRIVSMNGETMNVTAQVGSPVSLHCLIKNLQDKTVSWLKRTFEEESVPILLTFGDTVYVKDPRISIHKVPTNTDGVAGSLADDWKLEILHSKQSDTGQYRCQISTEPPQIYKIHLNVEAPVLTVMDGFGRELLDQFYKVGSSLEVMCMVDRLPQRPLPQIIEWRHGTKILPPNNATLGQRTELEGKGAISRLSITQANVRHSGIYTCSVSDSISLSLKLHIIDESKPVPIITNSAGSRGGLSDTTFFISAASLVVADIMLLAPLELTQLNIGRLLLLR